MTCAVLVAIAVPDIGPLVSLVGSVGFSTLGVIIPVFMDTVWHWYPSGDDDAEPEYDGPEVVHRSANGFGAARATAATNGGRATAADGGGGFRDFGRNVRHIKNAVLLVLALVTVVGGAYFNILDIVNMASGDVAPMI